MLASGPLEIARKRATSDPATEPREANPCRAVTRRKIRWSSRRNAARTAPRPSAPWRFFSPPIAPSAVGVLSAAQHRKAHAIRENPFPPACWASPNSGFPYHQMWQSPGHNLHDCIRFCRRAVRHNGNARLFGKNIQLIDQAVQIVARDSQGPRRLRLLPAALAQRPQNQALLEFANFQVVGMCRRTFRKILFEVSREGGNSMVVSSASTTARCTTFSNSRTFPGQEHSSSACSAELREPFGLLAKLIGELLHKMMSEFRNALAPFTQRRQMQLHDIQAIKRSSLNFPCSTISCKL